MYSTRRGLSIAVLLLTVVGMTLAKEPPSARPPAVNAETEAIAAVIQRQQTAWNRGDLESFLSGYWRSPRLVFQSGGDRHDGWEATRERYLKRYKSEGRAMGTVAFSKLEIELLGPDAALVRGAWRLTLPDGPRPGGLFTLIFRKLDDGWKIVHDHTSMETSKP